MTASPRSSSRRYPLGVSFVRPPRRLSGRRRAGPLEPAVRWFTAELEPSRPHRARKAPFELDWAERVRVDVIEDAEDPKARIIRTHCPAHPSVPLHGFLGHVDKSAMQSTHIDDTASVAVETTILAIVVIWAGNCLVVLKDHTDERPADDSGQASLQSVYIRSVRSPMSA
jgi:hypothetical protein